MDIWCEKLTRENIEAFYFSNVYMVYSSVFSITKETTRAEQAIIKSYLEVYQQRGSIKGEDVPYVFGDILLRNANEIVEKYPLPDNISFAQRTLDEYTRNSMLEKLLSKIDSTGFKVAEFISSDAKKPKGGDIIQRILSDFPITPLLMIQIVGVGLIIWLVSYAAVTVPYRNAPLYDDSDTFNSVSVQEKYTTLFPYLPLNLDFPASSSAAASDDTQTTNSTAVGDVSVSVAGSTDVNTDTTSSSEIGPTIATTAPSATRG